MGTHDSRARHLALALGLALLVSAGVAVAQEPGPGKAQRALVKFDGEAFELISLSSLDTVLPPSDDLPEAGAVSGFWFELQDGDGIPIYRRVVGDPVRLVFEGPSDEVVTAASRLSRRSGPSATQRRITRRMLAVMQGGLLGASFESVDPDEVEALGRFSSRIARAEEALENPVRTEAIPDERFFTLLIPAEEEGGQLVLFSSPLELGTQAAAATEMARFDLQVGQ